MTNVNSHLSTFLRRLRGEASLYQVEQDMGISRSLLRRYEIGERIPEDTTLKKLASYYGVEFSELKFKQFDDMYPENSVNRKLIQKWVGLHLG